MKKIINQAPIVRYRPFVSEKFFLFLGIELFQQNQITVLTLCAMLFAICLPAQAQQPSKIPRIGYLFPSDETNTPRFRAAPFDSYCRRKTRRTYPAAKIGLNLLPLS